MPSPDPETVLEALAGRPLVSPGAQTRGRCRRCLAKNHVREALGVGELMRDPTFADGERVRLTAVPANWSDVCPSTPRERRWTVTTVVHADHPLQPLSIVADPDQLTVRCAATVRTEGWEYHVQDGDTTRREYDPGALVLRSLAMEAVSPVGEGRSPDSIGELQASEPSPGDPRPDWPPAERRWRRQLLDRYGDLDSSPPSDDETTRDVD